MKKDLKSLKENGFCPPVIKDCKIPPGMTNPAECERCWKRFEAFEKRFEKGGK